MRKALIFILSAAALTQACDIQHYRNSRLCEKARAGDKAAVTELEELAGNDISEAQVCLGGIYYWGKGAEINYPRSYFWYRKAAQREMPEAELMSGVMSLKGTGTKKNYAEATAMIKKAWKHGNKTAGYDLALLYTYGIGTGKDYGQAFKLLNAYDSKTPNALKNTGAMYENGWGTEKDGQKALIYYNQAAAGKYYGAYTRIGDMYYSGVLGPADNEKAALYYKRAAAYGDSVAMDNLGWIYENSEGEGHNADEALNWYFKAASAGNAHAFGRLKDILSRQDSDARAALKKCRSGKNGDTEDCDIYIKNIDLLKIYIKALDQIKERINSPAPEEEILNDIAAEIKDDGKKAYPLYNFLLYILGAATLFSLIFLFAHAMSLRKLIKAAKNGDREAQFKLASIIYEKKPNRKNYETAAKWFIRSAANGNTNSVNKLIEMYYMPIESEKDYPDAFKWYTMAAEKGIENAQLILALMYLSGRGIPKDRAKAAKLFRAAAEKGSKDAWYCLKKLATAEDSPTAQFCLGELYQKGLGVQQDTKAAMKCFRAAARHGDKEAKLRLTIADKLSQENAPAEEKLDGKVYGRTDIKFSEKYRIIEEIARGGMGIVYKAVENRTGRLAAAKRMREEIRSSARLYRKFMHEAETVAGLKHPNIVQLYDIIEEEKDVYIVFEYLDGETLRQILSAGKIFKYEEALDFLRPVTEAIKYAHSQKIIHRDIKPSNIMRLKNGSIKVMDFGIARQAKNTITKVTGLDEISGTLAYMAPEQHIGKGSYRSDIYSLAVTLYEMITGETPFRPPQNKDMYLYKQKMIFKSPSKINPSVPKEADRLMAACLYADPEKRLKELNPELLKELFDGKNPSAFPT